MSLYKELKGDALDAKNRLEEVLVAKASRELSLSRAELTVRELRPEDLGLTREWTFNIASTGATANAIINAVTIADNRFIGVYGVRYGQTATQQVNQLEVSRAGRTVRYYQIQGTAYTEDATSYFDDPFTVDQNTVLTMNAYATATNATEKLILLGLVVEKKGLVVAD